MFTTEPEKSTLHIQPAHMVQWGRLSDCATWLQEAPVILDGDYLTIFHALDCLLTRQQKVWERQQLSSMADLARRLVRQGQAELEEIGDLSNSGS